MTQEDKELLLKDLAARLPYRVTCKRYENAYELVDIDIKRGLVYLLRDEQYVPYSITSGDEIKPYLRPMSSMTAEEREELEQIMGGSVIVINEETNDFSYNEDIYQWNNLYDTLDWLNSHHFDYRGLIDKGLAVEVANIPYNP